MVLIGILSFACKPSVSQDDILNSLKDGQARIRVTIDGQPFYPDSSVFTGTVSASDRFFKISLFDQFDSNVIVAFNGERWYSNKPFSKPLYANNQLNASVMMGRITDKANQYGVGYLMTDGLITVDHLSREKIIIHIEGKGGKYAHMAMPEKWNDITADIIYKRPPVKLESLPEASVFF